MHFLLCVLSIFVYRGMMMRQSETTRQKDRSSAENVVTKARQEVVQGHEHWYHLSRKAAWLAAFYLLLFVLFTLLAGYVYFHPVIAIDVAITQEFQENQSPWLRNFMLAVSYLGNTVFIFIPLIVLTALVFWAVHLRLEAIFILGLSTVSFILNNVLKLLVHRPRPSASLVEIIQQAQGQSFPSGHVMSYVAFWGLLFSFTVIVFKRDRWWRYPILLISALFVILVGPSRIYLGDHWATDVLGAYLIGGLLLGLSLWLYRALMKRHVFDHDSSPITQKELT
jgi:membrane-associated phospholipid phosphatase